jgi:HEAT repeat protein
MTVIGSKAAPELKSIPGLPGPITLLDSHITYEPRLLDSLLDDLLRGDIDLPHLQIICTELYASLETDQSQATSAVLNKLGGAEAILGSYLTTELQKLPGQQAKIARDVLIELVSSESTKRTLTYQTLTNQVKANTVALDETLKRLVNARLLQRLEKDGTISYKLANQILAIEIGRWIDRNDLEFKHVEELLARETTTWRIHGTLIPEERLTLLLPHYKKFKNSDNDTRLTLYLSALKHRSEEVRIWATESLGQLGDCRAVEPLISALTRYYGNLRDTVTRALAELGEPAVAPLLATLKDEQIQVRNSAADALSRIGQQALDPLINALKDEDAQVRSNAARALGELKDPRAVEPLIAALNDFDGPVRYMSARALARFEDGRAVEPLIAILNDEDWRVRDRAAKALGLLGDRRAIDPLIAALGDTDVRVRERATEALGLLKESALEPLITALPHNNGYARSNTAKLLGQLGDSRAVIPLIDILKDTNDSVRSNAVEALGRLNDERAVELLKNALRDSDELVRRGAAEALGRLGIVEVDLLIAALKDNDWSVRRSAVIALGQLEDSKAVDPLVSALMDDDWRVRSGAAVSLGQFGEQAVSALLAALDRKDIVLNKSTIIALRMIGTPEALAPLKRYGLVD